ncbi:fasciclin domain-containing protein [Aurantiacibacter poecillastricola]|uniref:fasciclin domain-containing protein n=1 Tax=Aurantiacibacter poecillastricola TaxID=3064385 RepID=UPI00273E94A2|nr:fasciclin domain-containing protein [Aurantiacibacter sp. 219JJ12-13]MDP5262853.1 fasciclin domain-containing protein [Aurantiacibacter sp. 219JJ12-13]
MTKRPFLTAFAACSALPLAACGAETSEQAIASEVDETRTLAALMSGDESLSTSADLFDDAGLRPMFDGSVPYTVFAPTNAAYDGLNVELGSVDAGAARAAILREHIVPGHLTREDIAAAIASTGGAVEMQTMGSGTLTFTGDAENLRVASSDGSEASVSGTVLQGPNGAVFPVDGLLKTIDQPA